MGKKEKKARKKGKKVRKGRKHESIKQHKFYSLKSGAAERAKKPCPRCGPGTWLAVHKGRVYCGRCSYTEFMRAPAKPEPKPEHKPEGKPKPEEKKE